MARKAGTGKPAGPDDYDSPWKTAIGLELPDFFSHYFPQVFALVDWSVAPVFLDTELNKLTRNANTGKRHADKLVQVTLLSGEERLIYIHIEVQTQHDSDLAERVFIYNYRIFDRFRKPVASLVVLADGNALWRPEEFFYDALGCRMGIRFLTVKLADSVGQEEALLRSDNAFALVTLAHLLTQATANNMQRRLTEKWRLTKLLASRAWKKQRILALFEVIDWMMHLPPDLATELWQNIGQSEEEQNMRYVNSIHRLIMEQEQQKGREEGREEGRQEALQEEAKKTARRLSDLLTHLFGELPKWADDLLGSAPIAQLDAWYDRAFAAKKMEDVFGDTARSA